MLSCAADAAPDALEDALEGAHDASGTSMLAALSAPSAMKPRLERLRCVKLVQSRSLLVAFSTS